MTSSDLVGAILAAGYEPEAYSGRGMTGRQCVGVVCDRPIEVVLDVIQSLCRHADGVDEVEDLVEALSGSHTDNMAMQTVIYWPKHRWEEDE
jgi:hypothetical protein